MIIEYPVDSAIATTKKEGYLQRRTEAGRIAFSCLPLYSLGTATIFPASCFGDSIRIRGFAIRDENWRRKDVADIQKETRGVWRGDIFCIGRRGAAASRLGCA